MKENDLVNIKVKKDTKSFKIQVSFIYNKQLIFIEKNNIDFYAGLDEICGVIKNKMSKTHNKTISKHKKRINAIRNIEEEEEFIDEVDFIFNKNPFNFGVN